MICRLFGVVFSRLLLHKQDEFRTMEETLDTMDAVDSLNAEGQKRLKSRIKSHRHDVGEQTTRTQLLAQLEKKVLVYSGFVVICRRWGD